ncbi:efflux RND transporter permease subunit [Longibacter sp.]|uniref:efflux RND transporter permease subunit n=1 Tax=Longibacter sp. TaxID=2045415 RepID=UPI003EB69F42
MDITRYAIENKVVTAVVLVAVLFAGIQAYLNLPRAEDPGFKIRVARVITPFPGASPQRVEQLVTDKLEQRIQEIPEVDNITSTSRTSVSIISVALKDDVQDLQPVFDKLRRKVEQVGPDLPAGVVSTVDDEFGDVFGTLLTLTGDGFSYRELEETAEQVRSELLKIEDVAKVEIIGAQPERVFVVYDNARLAELGLSTGQLQNILQTSNIIIPGGAVQTGVESITLEPSGAYETVEAIRRTVIRLPGTGDVVFLGDIADVNRGYVDPRTEEVRVTGEEGLVLAISMRDGGDIIGLGDDVLTTVRRLEQRYPIGLSFGVLSFQPGVVERSVGDFTSSVFQAIGIVILSMLIFLGLRTGLVVATLIPMAMVATLMMMDGFNIGLDQISLAALIIALGLLVDNAIVMSEAILVEMEEGKSAVEAAVASARELRIPLLVSSLTTAAAFLPIYLAESTVGEYTAPLAQVITITLLSSWLLAITMIPLFCVLFLRVKRKRGDTTISAATDAGDVATGDVASDDASGDAPAHDEGGEYDSPFYRRYRDLLTGLLKRPALTLLAAYGLLLVSLWGFGFVEQIFFPEKREVLFTGELNLPYGTSFEQTQAVVADIEGFMDAELASTGASEPGLENWTFFVGTGAPRFNLGYSPEQGRSNYAALIANTTSFDVQNDVMRRLRGYVEQRHPGLDAKIRPLSSGPATANPIEVRLFGDDADVLFGIVDQVKQQVASIDGTINISDNWGQFTKKLRVEIDEVRARRAGVSNQDIAVSLQTALSGVEATQFREAAEIIPVTLRSGERVRESISRIESINMYAQATGRNVPLGQVADIELAFEPSQILRRDRSLAVTVRSGLDPAVGRTAFDISEDLTPWLEAQQEDWPLGYGFELGGDIEGSSQATASITEKLPIAGIIILLLLVWQFNSIRKPTIILLTIPLSVIGVTFGLLITGQPFGFMALLGIIALAGIVINNAIVLLDRIDIEMNENGHPPDRAIVESAQRRFRPILLTTATTAGGLIPLWLGGGPLFEAMAVSILFGLLFATVLTLGFVPALYALLFRVNFSGFTYPSATSNSE